jgi:hypothetical protein
MESKIVEILNRHQVMALATLRPDGWPQATMVHYVPVGIRPHFIISRRSQKFANISQDDRVSIALGPAEPDPRTLQGLSMAAHAQEVVDSARREEAWELICRRRKWPTGTPLPDFTAAAMFQARPRVISVIDYRNGSGHADLVSVGVDDIVTMKAARPDDWGFAPSA